MLFKVTLSYSYSHRIDMLNVLPVPNPTSITTTTNDQLGVLYLASLGRCLVKLHSLIDNKIENEVSV